MYCSDTLPFQVAHAISTFRCIFIQPSSTARDQSPKPCCVRQFHMGSDLAGCDVCAELAG